MGEHTLTRTQTHEIHLNKLLLFAYNIRYLTYLAIMVMMS